MLNPMSVELLSRDLASRRLAEAAQDALAAQLPRSPASRPLAPARHLLAFALRGLAFRLDPSIASEPAHMMAVARSR